MKEGGRVKFSVGDKKWGGIKKSCEHITVRKEMKCNGDSEILHHDNARIYAFQIFVQYHEQTSALSWNPGYTSVPC